MRFNDPQNDSNIVINHNLQELTSCMVPIQRFQFMITSMAPMKKTYFEFVIPDVQQLQRV